MKKIKFLIVLTMTILLTACNLDSSEEQKSEHKFSDYASINEELETVFDIDDEIPDFDEYITINDSNVSYEIKSDFEGKEYFDESGSFIVKFIINIDDEESVSYDLDITVNKKTNYYSKLRELLNNVYAAPYVTYNTTNDVTFKNDNSTDHLQSSTDNQFFFDQSTGENLFHTYTEYDINGVTNTIESYFYFDEYNINFYTSRYETNYEWLNEVVSLQDYFAGSGVLGNKTLINLLDKISVVNAIEEDSNTKTFQIPLSDDNFSISMATDILDAIEVFELYDTESEQLYSILSNNYNLITLKITTDKNLSKIIEIEYDYTLLLNHLLQEDNSGFQELSVTTMSNTFEKAVYKESNFDTDSFQLTIPIDVIYDNVKQTSSTIVDAGGTILDSLVDEENNQVFYTVSGSQFLYVYNYNTHQIDFISFDLFPEHLYLRNGKVYVSLFGGEHKYYWPTGQYGAFAVVDAQSVAIDNVFDIDFDPGDIVVDKDNIVYIIHGSYQHTSIESFNPISGMKIDSASGVYYDGTLLYSEYTNRIYEVENHSSASNFKIYSVDRGDISFLRYGNSGFNKESLKMSNDGKYIYSGNGIVYELTMDSSQDTNVTHNLEGVFYDIAFNDVDGLRYFSLDGIIAAFDNNDELQYVAAYSGVSEELNYGDGMLFNVFESYIEIIDLEIDEDTTGDSIVTTISLDENFDPTQYVNTVTNGAYEISLISNNLDVSTMGTYEVVYAVSSIFGVDVDIQLILIVNVVDDIGPEIIINSEPSTINVGDTYTPAGCTAIDNVDGQVVCELYENNVDPNQRGEYEVIYKAIDSSGNITYKTTIIKVELVNLSSDVSPIEITANVSDIEFDSERNAFYYIDSLKWKLIKYNISDNTVEEIKFELLPEHMVIDGDTLYVTILTGNHSSYWWEEDQTGKIAVIDLNTFTLSNIVDINADPYSINVYNDYLYIGPGSGQWVNIQVYDKNTMEFLGTSCGVREMSNLKVDQSTGYMYTVSNSSPKYMEKYLINGTTCDSTYSSPDRGEDFFGDEVFISPYQDYIFTSNGKYYAYAQNSTNPELNYEGDLEFSFNDMYFDETNKVVYYGLANGYVYVADQENGYNAYAEINTGYPISKIVTVGDTIYIFSIDNGSGKLVFVEVTDVNNSL